MQDLDIIFKEYADSMAAKNKTDWIPIFLYDALEESFPSWMVIKLGEIIINNKGVGTKK